MNPRHLSLIVLLVASVLMAGCGRSTPAPTGPSTMTPAPAPTLEPAAAPSLAPEPVAASTLAPEPVAVAISSAQELDGTLMGEMMQRCSQDFASLQGSTPDRPLLEPGDLYALIGKNGVWTELAGLQSPFRTTDPEGARYLLCVQQINTQVSTYTDKAPAYQTRWEIHLVSFPDETVRRGINLTGGKPPETKRHTGPGFGSAPFDELVDWIDNWVAPPTNARQSVLLLGKDGTNRAPLALAFTPDGQALVSGEMFGGLYLWPLVDSAEPEQLERHKNEIYALALTPDGDLLAVVDRDQRVTVYRLTTRELVAELAVSGGYPRSVALSPDGGLVVVGTDCGQITVFDVASGETIFTFAEETCPFTSMVAMSPDGKRLTGIQPGQVAITWDLETGQEISRVVVPAWLVELALLNDGQNLAVVAAKGEVVVRDAAGKTLHSFQATESTTAAFSPDGRLLATGSYQGGVKLWDVQTGEASDIILAGPVDGILALVFSPDSQRLAAGAGDSKVYLWDVTHDSLPSSASPSSPATPRATTPRAVPTAVLTAVRTTVPTATPAPTATRTMPTPTVGVTEVDRQAIVQSATLNLRSGPGQGYPVVGQLARGDKMYPTASFGNCEWIQVGVLGGYDLVWVAGGPQYVKLNVPCDKLLVADDMWPTPVPVPTAASVDAPRPATGLLSRPALNSGPGELLIKNGTDSDGVVILVDGAGNPAQAAYIRAGESFRMTQIADGTYRLFFSKGDGWDAARKEFARNVTRQRFADPLAFVTQGGQYTGYEVTLYGVSGGNAGTQNVPPGQFPAVP